MLIINIGEFDNNIESQQIFCAIKVHVSQHAAFCVKIVIGFHRQNRAQFHLKLEITPHVYALCQNLI
jgi:hypothetical protein